MIHFSYNIIFQFEILVKNGQLLTVTLQDNSLFIHYFITIILFKQNANIILKLFIIIIRKYCCVKLMNYTHIPYNYKLKFSSGSAKISEVKRFFFL